MVLQAVFKSINKDHHNVVICSVTIDESYLVLFTSLAVTDIASLFEWPTKTIIVKSVNEFIKIASHEYNFINNVGYFWG